MMRHRALGVCMIAFLVACVAGCSNGPSPKNANNNATGSREMSEAMSETSDTSSEGAPSDDGGSNASAGDPDKVLRHAVFFQFKPEATEEQIDEVVRAFSELPAKIEAIEGFEWGVNNSPEGLDDGFTHCFLLTFRDEAGREEYLPHPAHKAFGDVLRPHMADVFVIDYWGDAKQPKVDKPLRHAVFFRFKEDADPEAIRKVERAFAELPSKIDAIQAFEWGVNNSPEKHDDGFTHCFLVTFDSEDGRASYLPHPDHQAFVELLQPVLDQPRVLDFRSQ